MSGPYENVAKDACDSLARKMYEAFADPSTWTRGGPGSRKQLPDEETGNMAYWTVHELDGSYWSVMFDKREAEYVCKRYKERADGDGESLLETVTGREGLGLAMLHGLFWTV